MSRTSRRLSRVLRHAPEEAGLALGPGSWVEVADLLQGLERMGHAVSRAELDGIVAGKGEGSVMAPPVDAAPEGANGHPSGPVPLITPPEGQRSSGRPAP